MTIDTSTSVSAGSHREPAATDAPPCVVCGAPSTPHMSLSAGHELRRCTRDGLVFASPMELPSGPTELFAQAYTGKIAAAQMEMFHHRMIWRADLLRNPAAAIVALAPVQRKALAYFRKNVAAGSPVLDIGCGSGLFLQALQGAGYDQYGLEVAGPVVDFLHGAGFDVFHGTVNDVPDGRFDPVICTSFFVLHHVTDPLDFLTTIRRKFPRASLLLTEHYFGRNPYELGSLNLPPRRLTCWNPDSLALALEKAGFRPRSIKIMEAEPYHPAIDSRLMGLYCRTRKVVPAAMRPSVIASYIGAKRLLFGAARRVLGYRTFLAQEHILAIADPR
ncbi:MAG TPA: class I SAM-dependent methyltransferase [Dehalococcoidia bacterium]|nr:class I SAM-dependent methyltransferase [Dehalococcoidia bacterium]